MVAVGLWKLFDWLNEKTDDEALEQRKRSQQPPIPALDAHDKSGRKVAGEEEGGWEVQGDEAEDEEEEEEALLFFPTGFSRARPRTYYKGSDPEWQAFIRVTKDPRQMQKIRSDLVTMTREHFSKMPKMDALLGKIDTTKGATWIDITFPEGPPVEYERPGIVLTEDLTLRKGVQSVDSRHHEKLANVLMPTAVADSVYSDMKRRLHYQWLGLKRYAGFEVKQSPVENMMRGLPSPPSKATSATQPTVGSTTLGAPTAADAEKQAQPLTPSAPTIGTLTNLAAILPDPEQAPTMKLSHLRNMMRRHRKHVDHTPPRGTILVTGLIELIGNRAKLVLDVTACYDPSMARYVRVDIDIRSAKRAKQGPRGGP